MSRIIPLPVLSTVKEVISDKFGEHSPMERFFESANIEVAPKHDGQNLIGVRKRIDRTFDSLANDREQYPEPLESLSKLLSPILDEVYNTQDGYGDEANQKERGWQNKITKSFAENGLQYEFGQVKPIEKSTPFNINDDQKNKTESLGMQKIYCNECLSITNHKQLHHHRNQNQKESPKDEQKNSWGTVDSYCDWEVLECQGCENMTLKKSFYCSEWQLPINDTPYLECSYYPPLNTDERQKPSWYENLVNILSKNQDNDFLLQAYNSVYKSLKHQLAIATMLTMRALLENIAIKNGSGDTGSFQKNIQFLERNGHITTKQSIILKDAIYDAGSATMHRGYQPSREILENVLDIIEKLIHTIYIEPRTQQRIQDETPERNLK